MRRLRGRTPHGLISPTLLWLIAGWAVVSLVFIVLIAFHRLAATGDNIGAAVAASVAWLTLVLFANSVDELRETITNTPEDERPSRRSAGWRPPWGPAAAALLGVAVGWLGWK